MLSIVAGRPRHRTAAPSVPARDFAGSGVALTPCTEPTFAFAGNRPVRGSPSWKAVSCRWHGSKDGDPWTSPLGLPTTILILPGSPG